MGLQTRLRIRNFVLNEVEVRQIQRHIGSLRRRLTGWPDPRAALTISWHEEQRRVEVRLRVRLGHLGSHFVSRRSAETADLAARLAIEDIKRQVERERSAQRGPIGRRRIWGPHFAQEDTGEEIIR